MPSSFNVGLQVSDDGRIESIRYQIDGGAFQAVQVSARPEVAITNLMGGPHTLRVVVEDDDGLTTELTRSFIVDATLPEFESIVVQSQNLLNRGDFDITLRQGDPLFVQVVGSDDIDSLPVGAGTPFLQVRLLINGEVAETNQSLDEALGTLQVEPGQGGRLSVVLDTGDDRIFPGGIGKYDLSFVLIDIVGNTATYNRRVTVEVQSGDGPASDPPSVFWTEPFDAQSIVVGETVPLRVEASDPDGFVGAVRFFVGGTLVGTDANGSDGFSAELDTSALGAGSYELRAEAIDDTGETAEATISINLVAEGTGNTPPDVFFTQPLSGQRFEQGSSLTLAAAASDPDEGDVVTRVRFFVEDSLVGEDATRNDGFSASLDTTSLSADTYTLRAIAIDGFGASTETSVTIDIIEPDTAGGLPEVFWTDPLNNQRFEVGTSLQLAVNANDPDGSVVQARFLLGGNLLSEDTTPADGFTSTFDTTGVSTGGYVLLAVVTDNDGNTAEAELNLELVDPGTIGETQPPEVFWVDPFAGRQFAVGTEIPLVVDAVDPDGDVTGVRFFANNTLVGNDTTSGDGFGATFDTTNLSLGEYELRAVATDDAGERGEATISIELVDQGAGNQTPPEVFWTQPFDAQQFQIGETIDLAVSASDADGNVARVRFFLGNTLLITDEEPSDGFSTTLDTNSLGAGSYELRAQVIDDAGNATDATISVELTGTLQPPEVFWIDPFAGRQFAVGAEIPLVVEATDPDGNVAGVRFFANNTLVGNDTTPSDGFGATFNTTDLSLGGYELRAVATDDAGERSEAIISIELVDQGAGNQIPPEVFWTQPFDAQQFQIGEAIDLTVSASDADGNVARVRFFLGNTLLITDEEPNDGFSTTLNTSSLNEGSYELRAQAIDDAGNTTDATISIELTSALQEVRVVWLEPLGTQVGGTVPLRVRVEEPATGNAINTQAITSVAFFADVVELGQGTLVSDGVYSFDWDTEPYVDQSVELRAVATTDTGETGEAVRTVTVSPSPPDVTITAPQDGETVSGTISVVVDPRDTQGISRVVLIVNGTPGPEKTSAPYTFSLDTTTLSNGPFTLQAFAENTAGIGAFSSIVNLVSDNLLPPQLSITQPADGAELGVIFDVGINVLDRETPFEYTEGITVEVFDFRGSPLAEQTTGTPPDSEDFNDTIRFDLGGNAGDNYTVRASTQVLVNPGEPDELTVNLRDEVRVNVVIPSDLPPALVVFAPSRSGVDPIFDTVFYSIGSVTDEDGSITAVETRMVCDACGNSSEPINALLNYNDSIYGPYASEFATDATPFLPEADSYKLRVTAIDDSDQDLRNIQEIDAIVDRTPYATQAIADSFAELRAANLFLSTSYENQDVFPARAVWTVDLSGVSNDVSYVFIYRTGLEDDGGTAGVELRRGTAPAGTDEVAFTATFTTDQIGTTPNVSVVLQDLEVGPQVLLDPVAVSVSEPPDDTGGLPPGDGTGQGSIVIDWIDPSANQSFNIGDVVALEADASGDNPIESISFSFGTSLTNRSLVGTDTTPTDGFTAQLDTSEVAEGTYTLYALATDSQGNRAERPLTITLIASGGGTGEPAPGDGTGPGSIQIDWVQPRAGQEFFVGDIVPLEVQVSGDNPTDNVRFSYGVAGSDERTLISTDSTGNDGFTTSLDTTGLAAGDYTLYALATDREGNRAERTLSVTVSEGGGAGEPSPGDGTGPGSIQIDWVQPRAGQAFFVGDIVPLQVQVSGDNPTDNVRFSYAVSNSDGRTLIGTDEAGFDGFTELLNTNGLIASDYTLYALATDSEGNRAERTLTITVSERGEGDPSPGDGSGPGGIAITWLNPQDGDELEIGTPVTLRVDAAADFGDIASVRFSYLGPDGIVEVGTDSSGGDGVYDVNLNTTDLTAGVYVLTALATSDSDENGDGNNDQAERSIGVTVTTGDIPPGDGSGPGNLLMTWQNPQDGDTFDVGQSIPLEIDVSGDNAISSVEFSYSTGGTFTTIGTDGGSPFTETFNTSGLATGDYILRAIATDNQNNQAQRSITITLANTSPSVTWLDPNDGDQVIGTVTLQVEATDPGGIQSVTFLANGSQIGTGTQSIATQQTTSGTFSFSWDSTGVDDGQTTLTARATDLFGNTTDESISVFAANNDQIDPTVSWNSPFNGQQFEEGSSIQLTVEATDNATVLGASNLSFAVDGQALTGSVSQSGNFFTTTWNAPSQTGTFTLSATVTDDSGNTASASINVELVAQGNLDATDPTISWQVPTNNATVQGTSVTLEASATDSGGSGLNRVEFSFGSTPIDTGAPVGNNRFRASWDSTTVSDGTYVLTARAIDNAGNVATATINVNVSNAPQVTWVRPASDGATIAGITTLQVSVTAQRTVSSVQLALPNQTVSATLNSTSGLYEFVWNATNVSPGSYTLTATATDNSGATGSANRNVVVEAPFSITNPADGATFTDQSGTVDVTASPNGSLTGISNVTDVDFFFNGTNCGITPTGSGTGPYTFAWDPAQSYPCHDPNVDGNRVITAQLAYTTTAGGSGTYTTDAITVSYNAIPPVTVSWQAPPANDFISGTVDLTVSATNADTVTFSIGGQTIGTGTATGTTNETVVFSWDSTAQADGSVTITAVASGTFNGQTETSDPAIRTFTVDNTVPSVNILSIDGETSTNGLAINETVQVVAEISDATSGVAQATFNGNTISPDTSGGTIYTVDFDTKQQTDGTFTFTFAATDQAGNQNSSSVNVLIDNTPPLASINLQDVDINAGGTTDISSSQDLPLTVVINSNDNGGSGIREVRVELSTNGGAFNTIATVGGGRQTVSLNSPQLEEGNTYRIRAIASDNAGNEPSIVELNTLLNIIQ